MFQKAKSKAWYTSFQESHAYLCFQNSSNGLGQMVSRKTQVMSQKSHRDIHMRVIAILPLSCFMTVISLAIHKPDHVEGILSLAMLDIAGGRFSQLEIVNTGCLSALLHSLSILPILQDRTCLRDDFANKTVNAKQRHE